MFLFYYWCYCYWCCHGHRHYYHHCHHHHHHHRCCCQILLSPPVDVFAHCVCMYSKQKVFQGEGESTQEHKKAGQMDSGPNTYKHGRVMTAGVYIAVPCLKIQQCEEMETALTSQSRSNTVGTCFYPQTKRRACVIPFSNIRLYKLSSTGVALFKFLFWQVSTSGGREAKEQGELISGSRMS